MERLNGCDGRIVVKWKMKDIIVVGGRDYENISGEVVFEYGELIKMIEINIKDDLVCKEIKILCLFYYIFFEIFLYYICMYNFF